MPKTKRSPVEEKNGLERYVIPNLRNAFLILRLLGSSTNGLKASEIARSLSLPVSTTSRILATLQLEGVVRKTDWRFALGPMLIHLGNASLAGTEIRVLAIPVLHELTEKTMETAHLAIPCDGRSLIVAVQDSPHPLRAASRPGFLAELHCSSTGKVFLSFLENNRLPEVLRREKPIKRTANTLVTADALRREIELIRSRGYSVDDEEYFVGVRCLAAPVFDSDGAVVASIGITAATVRFPPDKVEEMANHVVAAAKSLSNQLGS